MINNLKEETQKLVLDFKDDVNKQWAQRGYKQISEIKKTIQDMNKEINEDTETLKNNQSELTQYPK
jgi:gas vesicle protein